jgi:hypothetical protein
LNQQSLTENQEPADLHAQAAPSPPSRLTLPRSPLAPTHLFDIPVYRCSEIEYAKEFAKQKQRYMQSFDKETTPQTYDKVEKSFIQTYWYPWKFNEVIGYVHLTVAGSPELRLKIAGDLFYVSAKRTVKGGKDKIFYRGKIYEHFVWPKHTSQQIYADLLEGFEKLSKRRYLNKRYLYLEDFRRIGPSTNWRQVLGLE